MRATLSQGSILRERAAVAVEQGRAQLQRVTYGPKGQSTVEALSQWRPVEMLKPSIGMLMFHVRAANAYAQEGHEQHAKDALAAAHRCFQ
ncbi:MAG TPA: hypothetical protein VLH12_08630 [Usitatibacter sp.]|nr:hypothetical protein [Usitatibacter sp.]